MLFKKFKHSELEENYLRSFVGGELATCHYTDGDLSQADTLWEDGITSYTSDFQEQSWTECDVHCCQSVPNSATR